MLNRALIPAALAGIVEGLWGTTPGMPTSAVPRTVLPTGTVEIIFNFGGPLVHVDVDPDHALPTSYVTCQRTHPVVPVVRGEHDLLVISLFPWGAAALFPGCVSECDAYAPLSEFVDAALLAQLEDALYETTSLEARARTVLAFLDTLRRRNAHAPSRIVRHAAVRLTAARDRPSIQAVADDLGVSQRHLARCFRQHVGLAPKTYSRVMRFQASVAALRRGGRPASIASACGYTDQAHMTHDVRAFSGKTPRQIANQAHPRADAVTSRMFRCVYL